MKIPWSSLSIIFFFFLFQISLKNKHWTQILTEQPLLAIQDNPAKKQHQSLWWSGTLAHDTKRLIIAVHEIYDKSRKLIQHLLDKWQYYKLQYFLKGHGIEADFLRFLHKLVRHRSLTLHFEPFRFWLQILRDIRNQKTTPRLGESPTLRLGESGSHWLSDLSSRGVTDSPTCRVGESAIECLKEKPAESESRQLPDSASWRVGASPTRRFGE